MWCFTWNNYDANSECRLQNFNYKFLCYGREVGAMGTPHLQGIIVLHTPQRLSYLKSNLGSAPHWERCRDFHASVKYCQKEGNYFFDDRRQKRGRKKNSVVASGLPLPASVSTVPVSDEKIDSILKKILLNVKIV